MYYEITTYVHLRSFYATFTTATATKLFTVFVRNKQDMDSRVPSNLAKMK